MQLAKLSYIYTYVSQNETPYICCLFVITLANMDRFLQGVSIACYAEPCISYGRVVRLSVCLSVRPSVTRWHCVKTTQARITKSSSRIAQGL